MTPEPPFRFRRAAIVDDSSEFQLLARMMLGYVGLAEVHTFSNPTEALPALLASPPDLLLLDQMMAGMDGATMLIELRANPKTMTMPVIICTAAINKFLEQEERLRLDQLTIVLPKPFSIEDLQAAITQLTMLQEPQP